MDTLIVEVLDADRDGEGLFKVCSDFTYVDTVRGKVTVPAGYVTDFASIPRLFRWFFPIAGNAAKPALLHDYVKSRGVTEVTTTQERWATGIFNRALKANGVSPIRRFLMVAWVAVFSIDLYITP